jgi:hypothetical protein
MRPSLSPRAHTAGLVVVLVGLNAACGVAEAPAEPSLRPLWLLTVTPITATLAVGDSTQFRAIVHDPAALKRGDTVVTWQSSVAGVAEVDASAGRVVARAVGQTMVLATLRADPNHRAGALVTVVPSPK